MPYLVRIHSWFAHSYYDAVPPHGNKQKERNQAIHISSLKSTNLHLEDTCL